MAGSKETTAGRPSREALEACRSDHALVAACCDLEVVRLAFEGDRLVVASPLRRYTLRAEDLQGSSPRQAAQLPLAALHDLIQRADRDGLDFYCPDCDALYCERHYRCRPQFDEGFYDYTLACCPRGHERVIDD